MYLREKVLRWWHYVKDTPVALYAIEYSRRLDKGLGSLFLGVPAGIFCAVICWFMIDWMFPALDGTRLHFVGIWGAAKSSFEQVGGVSSSDLEWSFWARVEAILVINFLFVSLGTGSDIRDRMVNGVRPERWAFLNRCILAFGVCVVIAALFVTCQPQIQKSTARPQNQWSDF